MAMTQEQVERMACLAILQAVNDGILKWQNGGWKIDNARMQDYLREQREAKTVPGHKPAFKLRFAMPISTYFLLREQGFDGSADFDMNPEVMRWLMKQPEMAFLKEFPLAGVDPQKV